MNADGTGRKQLTYGAGKVCAPQVSPDGRYIVFESSRVGNRQIWRIDSDGGALKQLTNGDGEARPRFSSDGQHVYFSQDKTLKPIVGKIPVDGGAIEWLRHILSETPAVSPEGDLLAYPYETEGNPHMWKAALFSPADNRPMRIFDFKLPIFLPAGVHWSEDGKALNRGLTSAYSLRFLPETSAKE
jgi:TolB protein